MQNDANAILLQTFCVFLSVNIRILPFPKKFVKQKSIRLTYFLLKSPDKGDLGGYKH